MHSLFLILADSAQVIDGKLYMLGGAWNRIVVEALPVTRSSSIAAALAVPWKDSAERHSFLITLVSPNGAATEIGRGEFEVGRPPDIPEGTEQRLVLALPLELTLQQQGQFLVHLTVDGRKMGSVLFDVAQRRRAGETTAA